MKRLAHALLACVPLITMEYPIAPDFMPQGKATVKIEISWCSSEKAMAHGEPGVIEVKRTMYMLGQKIGTPEIQYLKTDGKPGSDPNAQYEGGH